VTQMLRGDKRHYGIRGGQNDVRSRQLAIDIGRYYNACRRIRCRSADGGLWQAAGSEIVTDGLGGPMWRPRLRRLSAAF
jgi:hypothetical protein